MFGREKGKNSFGVSYVFVLSIHDDMDLRLWKRKGEEKGSDSIQWHVGVEN